MARLSAEEKAILARMLEAEDDEEDTEDDAPEEDADEFTYRGKRYVYTPEELEEVQEEKPKSVAKKAPAQAGPRKSTTTTRKPAPKKPAEDPEPEPPTRRFMT